ncbi:hypothetical protein C8Q76DRAFT_566267, partial [Earliella scabrosa]
QRILGQFVKNPQTFLNNMEDYHGIVVGEAALAFILRDLNIVGDTLEVAVGREHASDLEELFVTFHWFHFLQQSPATPSETDTTVRLFRAHPRRPNRYVRLLISHSHSPLHPVARAPSTALINYVSPTSFGCAYPLLTLQRQGLIRLLWCSNVADQDAASDQQDASQEGHDAHPDPGQPGHNLDISGFCSLHDTTYGCLKELFVCPGQARFFGDRGSFVGFFDIAHISPMSLAFDHHTPYNPSVVWRFSGTSLVACESSCAKNDILLPSSVSEYGAVL